MSVTLAGRSGPKETHHVKLPWLVLVGPRKPTMSVTLAGRSGAKETHHVSYPGWS